MSNYKNPADDIGIPPFNKGDHVVSTNPNWSTMKAGRTAWVSSCFWSRTKRAWMIQVNHPKFGFSTYDAKWFKHYWQPTLHYHNPVQEKLGMHIALDITEYKKLDPSSIHSPLISETKFVAQDASLATLKNIINQELAKDPEKSFAIFSLTWIAEVEQPRPPVRWRDMK